MSEATSEQTQSRIEAEREGDQRADAKAILVIFCTTIAIAVHFISGWTF